MKRDIWVICVGRGVALTYSITPFGFGSVLGELALTIRGVRHPAAWEYVGSKARAKAWAEEGRKNLGC